MDVSAKEIITEIEKNFPSTQRVEIRNISDLNLESKLISVRQCIIGVTRSERSGGYVNYKGYERKIEQLLEDSQINFKCLGWPFSSYKLDEAKGVKELSDHFDADLEIDEMIDRLKIKKNDDDKYYIVITVVYIMTFSIK